MLLERCVCKVVEYLSKLCFPTGLAAIYASIHSHDYVTVHR